MSRILLIDTNFSSKPIYDFLNDGNNEVFVVGANTSDFLAKCAENYINFNYSDIVEMKALIKKLNVDYIVPGCNDRSYEVCAALNVGGNFYGLDKIDVTETILHKEKFRIFANSIDLFVPSLITIDQVKDKLPVIVKPVDAYSGHGITIITKDNVEKLEEAIESAKEFSRTKTFLIEEYIVGQLYSHSAFISDGSVLRDFIVEEHSTANRFVVDTSRVVFDFSKEMLSQIRNGISRMAKSLNMSDGLVHTQFIRKGDSFWIIEITRRCPGDLYSMLIEFSTGFRYAETYAKSFLNQKLILSDQPAKKKDVLRHTISQSDEAYFSALKFNCSVNIEKLVPISLTGDKVKASPFGRIALLFLKANSKKELNVIFEKTLKRELYILE
jgi:hypothetical protein